MAILHCSAGVNHKLCPSYLRDWLVKAEAYTGRSERNKDHLLISQVDSNIGKNGFLILEHVMWNNLPSALYGIMDY